MNKLVFLILNFFCPISNWLSMITSIAKCHTFLIIFSFFHFFLSLEHDFFHSCNATPFSPKKISLFVVNIHFLMIHLHLFVNTCFFKFLTNLCFVKKKLLFISLHIASAASA